MTKYNVIMVLNEDFTKLLMCKRAKEPYKGLLNLVGGKIEEGEEHLSSAYRELYEETGIPSGAIELKKFMAFEYHLSNIILEAYVGKVNEDIPLIEEVNELLWIDVNQNFFNGNIFAGEGNIGHMLEQVLYYKEIL